MKRFFILALILLGIMPMLPSTVVRAADVKIGVVDIQRIMKESRAAKNARAVLLKDVEQKRKMFNDKQNEVQAMEEELKTKGKDMTPQARKEKTDNLADEIKELKRLKSDMEEELKKKERELTQRLLMEIRTIVVEYLKKEKYTIILEKRSVVASDEAVDITDKILKLYDVVK